MKKIIAIHLLGMVLLLVSSRAFSQPGTDREGASLIQPAPLVVSLYKTTHLVFPYAIKSVDRGSPDILAQAAAPVDNILRVKAAKANFRETNLTIITADGALYSFVVRYTENPAILTMRLPERSLAAATEGLFAAAGSNEAALQRDAAVVAGKEATGWGPKDRKYGMQLWLGGIFLQDEVMFYQLRIGNRSSISYDTDQLRFYVRDRKQSKRTASQELELTPLHVHGNPVRIAGNSEQVVVYALPKMTIPDNKYLFVELLEKNGGRHLRLKLHNRQLVRAKVLAPGQLQGME